MIPPVDTLLKYDNAVLVSKSTDRKSPKVSLSNQSYLGNFGTSNFRWSAEVAPRRDTQINVKVMLR